MRRIAILVSLLTLMVVPVAAASAGTLRAGPGRADITPRTGFPCSPEAHRHNHGIVRDFGEGKVGEDPDGPEHTLAPDGSVLRVDRVLGEGALVLEKLIGRRAGHRSGFHDAASSESVPQRGSR